jgi:hypothetical protein
MEEIIVKKEAGVQAKQDVSTYYDFKSVMVVASAWLLFYVAMLCGLLTDHGRDVLASVSDLLARN